MICAVVRRAEPACGIRADREQPVSQALLMSLPHPLQSLTHSRHNRHRLRLTGKSGEISHQFAGFGIIDDSLWSLIGTAIEWLLWGFVAS